MNIVWNLFYFLFFFFPWVTNFQYTNNLKKYRSLLDNLHDSNFLPIAFDEFSVMRMPEKVLESVHIASLAANSCASVKCLITTRLKSTP